MFSGNNMIIALIVVVLSITIVLMFMASRRYKGVYHTNATPLYTDVPVTVTNGEVVPNTHKTSFPLEVSGGKANPAVNGNILNPATHSVSGFSRMLVNDGDLTCTAWHSTKFGGALSYTLVFNHVHANLDQ